ncbi:MAG: hypothetical protein M3Y48_24930 [Actinomycetota bacterium]|nr:hypothetical protein [Actinomycetota bacterium]
MSGAITGGGRAAGYEAARDGGEHCAACSPSPWSPTAKNCAGWFEVFDQSTGTVLASRNAGHQFAARSVVKLLIAVDALARDNGETPEGATQ